MELCGLWCSVPLNSKTNKYSKIARMKKNRHSIYMPKTRFPRLLLKMNVWHWFIRISWQIAIFCLLCLSVCMTIQKRFKSWYGFRLFSISLPFQRSVSRTKDAATIHIICFKTNFPFKKYIWIKTRKIYENEIWSFKNLLISNISKEMLSKSLRFVFILCF